MWCSVPPVLQDALLASDDETYFKPTPSRSGVFADWIGIYLDVDEIDWRKLEAIVEEAFRKVAPRSLSKDLQAGP